MRKATEEWLRSAQDDLETITEIVDNPQLTQIVAFHAQQSVEKGFKAILEERKEEIPHSDSSGNPGVLLLSRAHSIL